MFFDLLMLLKYSVVMTCSGFYNDTIMAYLKSGLKEVANYMNDHTYCYCHYFYSVIENIQRTKP